MAVTTPRETWTDSRITDLSKKVDEGFEKADKKMDAGFKRADERMDAGFKRADEKMDAGFARVDSDIRELRGDVKGLRKEMLAAAIVIISMLVKTQGF